MTNSNNQDFLRKLTLKMNKTEILYRNVLLHIYLHLSAIYGIYLSFTLAKWATVIFAFITYVGAMLGVTAGAHRLWSHRSFKAKTPLEVIFVVFISMANQTIIHWVTEHRLHHKYSDTNADPHNVKRGFFFSHMGWVFLKSHPDAVEKRKIINVTDLYNNRMVRFQYKNATLLRCVFCFILPTTIPIVFWDETISNSWHLVMVRYVFNLHVFFLINSAAHSWGTRPYDGRHEATESRIVSLITFGEGFHNYHHVFPYDYRNAAIKNYVFNVTHLFIDGAAKFGWTYDLKTACTDAVTRRALKTGDGSYGEKYY